MLVGRAALTRQGQRRGKRIGRGRRATGSGTERCSAACLPRTGTRSSKPWASRSRRCRRRTWRSCGRLWSAAERGDDQRGLMRSTTLSISWTSCTVGPLEVAGRHRSRPRRCAKSFSGTGLRRSRRIRRKRTPSSRPETRVIVGYHVTGRGKASGMDVEMSRWNVYGDQQWPRHRVDVYRQQSRSPRSRRPLGVGDVAGERGDREAAVRGLPAGTLTTVLSSCTTQTLNGTL